ncbi:hypothetical protein ACQBAT_13125 [Ornithinimicrobium sp. Y1847]|uniref:hypothetical protein n=1 Tax=Ornithinimicrobium sp. Y1847 TaxID=3405419 RepID=UPI003B677C66
MISSDSSRASGLSPLARWLSAIEKDFKFPNEDLSDVVSNVLFFQRNWMGFHVPAMLKVAQRIYNDVARDFSEPVANYEYYLSQVEGLFLPPGVLDLDEYGLPLPITLRFTGFGMRMGGSLNETLDSFITLARNSTVRNQLSEVELWFADDVLAGLGASL